jgi:hypothetical protein
MKPRELFGVAVKGVGLYFIAQGIYRLLQVLDVVIPLVTTEARFETQDRWRIGVFLFAAVLHFVISALFLKRGDWLVNIAYPAQKDSDSPKTDEKHDG